MVDDGRWTTPRVRHKFPTGELKVRQNILSTDAVQHNLNNKNQHVINQFDITCEGQMQEN